MRKLATVCASVSAAVCFAFYLLPHRSILPLAAVCGAAAVLLRILLYLVGRIPRNEASNKPETTNSSPIIRRRSDWIQRAFLCLLGAAIGFAAYALHWNATLRYALLWDGTEQTIIVRLMEEPNRGDDYTRLHVQRTENPGLDLLLYDYSGEQRELKPGDLLRVSVKLRRADLRRGEQYNTNISKNIYLTGTLRELESLGIRRMSLRTLAATCSRIVSDFTEKLFPADAAVFLRALMLGDKTDFYKDTALYARMRGAGFMHIAAVSGMHVAFLVGMIQLLFGVRPASSAAGIVLVWFFVFMTGASPSAVRAGIMQTVLVLAPIFRRENDGPTSLLAALALILLANPFSCASVSLQMSFSAMAGMVLLAPPLTRMMLSAVGIEDGAVTRRSAGFLTPVWRTVFSTMAASISVLVFSAPFSVLHFGTLALYSPLTNLLGLWAVSLCFCGGWLSCLTGMLFLPLGKFLVIPVLLLARYLIALAGLVCRLPHHLLSMQGTEMKLWLLLSYILVLLAWRSRAGTRFRILMPLTLCALTLAAGLYSARLRYRSADAVIAALNVGQGECVCVLSGEQTLVFDCGGQDNPGEIAANYLEGAGRESIDLLVLSHLHADHCNGVPMLLELMPVEEIVLSPDADADEGVLSVIADAAERHGTRLTLLSGDEGRSMEKLCLKLFAPPDAGAENERCIISLVTVGDYDMIMTGDSLRKAELELTERTQLPDAELLIVGHHGSQTSTDDAFLETVRPEDAVISVGWNSYGHPTREVLAKLQIHGCRIWRTDRSGTVEIRVKQTS